MKTNTELPKLSRSKAREAALWTARIEDEGLAVGLPVLAKRVTTDSRDYVTNSWWESGWIVELRRFDAVVQFERDGERQSSGLGLRVL
jgi:hypothetical protein